MGDNDEGYSHKNAADKGIKSVAVGANTAMPSGLSMKPLAVSTTPNGVVPGPTGISAATSADLKKLSPPASAGSRVANEDEMARRPRSQADRLCSRGRRDARQSASWEQVRPCGQGASFNRRGAAGH
jgi:hypothetical protein